MPSTARSRGSQVVEGLDTPAPRRRERRHVARASDRGSIARGRDTVDVGLNPFRETHRSPADYAMVVVAVLVCVALVAWAILG
jgi:hypothetical protein